MYFFQIQNKDTASGRTDRGSKAKNFYSMLTTKSVWLMLHFMRDVLDVLAEVSRKFQLQNASLSEVLSEIEAAVASLETLKERYVILHIYLNYGLNDSS